MSGDSSSGGVEHSSIVKGILAWIGVLASMGLPHTWGELAAMLASVYTTFLIFEFIWKKIFRPILRPEVEDTERGGL